MTKNNKKYCYREVGFYKEGYIGFIFMKGKDDDSQMLYPLELVYKDLKALEKRIKELKLEIKKNKDNPAEVYGGMILKLRFNRTSPLKKEFWKIDSEISLGQVYRIRQYLKMFKDGEKLYKIMVMPAFYDVNKKEWLLTNWLPVMRSITDDDLAKIAVMSNETQVDSSAKHMGLYFIEWAKGLDIDTGELIENNKNSEGFNC